jgi:hypothetical protein
MRVKYAVIFERAENDWAAYVLEIRFPRHPAWLGKSKSRRRRDFVRGARALACRVHTIVNASFFPKVCAGVRTRHARVMVRYMLNFGPTPSFLPNRSQRDSSAIRTWAANVSARTCQLWASSPAARQWSSN